MGPTNRGKNWLLLLLGMMGATCGDAGGDDTPLPPHDAGAGPSDGVGGTGGAGGSGGFTQCAQGRCDCDRQPDNGLEVAINDDPENCGACGRACPTGQNATPACIGGLCGMACDVGFADCSRADGCETALASAVTDCGACGHACKSSPPHGQALCVDGTCRVQCGRDFADCDLDDANGCEVDLNHDPENCGRCSHRCPFAADGGTCQSGLCELSCPTGRADCNVDISDGCEIDTMTDRLNCGACAVVCDGGACDAGRCEPG